MRDERLEAYRRLYDGLSDMVEGGRLTREGGTMKGHGGAHRWLRKIMGHNVYPRGIKKINPGQYLYLPSDGGMAYAFLLHGWLRVWVIYQARSSEPFNRRYRLEMAHDA